MAEIVGTSANDVIGGTIDADVINGGEGNDRINGNAGNDDIFGGLGSDILTGDAGEDRIYGEDGNDGVYGGGGNDFIDGGVGNDILIGDGGNDLIIGGEGDDKLYGGSGNDTLVGGIGNDLLQGDAGDDIYIIRAGEGLDTIVGGVGLDTVQIDLDSSQVTDALRAELNDFTVWAETQSTTAATGSAFTFASLGLTVSTIESLLLRVDGVETSIDDVLNHAPVVDPTAAFATMSDSPVDGVVAATDPDGDALVFAMESGPALGTIALDGVTGAFKYTPLAGSSGLDTFIISVTDAHQVSVLQTVTVDVTAVVEPVPGLTITGTNGNNTLVGTAGNDTITGRRGVDIMTGNGGNDTFVWSTNDAFRGRNGGWLDHITDFSAGDVLDFSEIFSRIGTQNLSSTISVTDEAGGTTIAIKRDRAFVDVVQLDDVHGLTLDQLLADGALIV